MNNVRKLKLISFLWGASYSLPILTLYFLLHGVSLQNVVISQTLFSVFSFLGEMPTGVFADKYGQKASIVSGYATEVLAMLTLIFVPHLFGFYAAYCLMGIGESFLSGSQESLLYETLKKAGEQNRYSREYGTVRSNAVFHFTISTFIAGLALSILGQSSYVPLMFFTLASLAIALVISLSLTDMRVKNIDPAKGSHVLDVLRQSVKLMRSNATLRVLTWVTILTVSGEYFLYGIYQPYFQSAKVPLFYIGFVMSAGSLLNFFVLKNVYRLEKYFSLEKIVLLVNMPLALGYLGMAFIVHPAFLVFAFLAMKGLFEASQPIVSDYVNEHTESHVRATVLSGLSFAKSLTTIFLRLGLAFIIGAWGTKSALIAQGLYLFIGVLLAYWLLLPLYSHSQD